MKQGFVFLFFILFFCKSAFSQDSVPEKRIKVLPVPAFGYAPETRFYIGAVALFTLDFYSDTLTRSSNAKIEFNYTWNKQVIIESDWNYFFKEEKWFTQGLVHYSKYPDQYFGIGAKTTDSGKVQFQSDRFKLEISGSKNLKGKWFAGLGFRYYNYSNIHLNQDTITYSELRSTSNKGISMILSRDSRNNILTPTCGSYFKSMFSLNSASTFYSSLNIDIRKYFSFSTKLKQTVSGRLMTNHVFGKAPFYDLSLLGSDKIVRGYFYGRYRDKQLTTFQTEYRTNLFWRIGLAAFGGISMIYPDLSTINSDSFKPNAGLGLRFLVDKKEGTNLRFDYAIGSNGQSGFYVSFGESF